MLIRRRKKEDADDIVTRVGDYNNAAALNYEPRDIGPVPPDYGVSVSYTHLTLPTTPYV